MINGKMILEILEEFQKADTKEGKIGVLKKYDSPRLREFFYYLYSPKIVFDVEIPDYKPSKEPAGLNFTYLDTELSKLYLYIKGHPKRPQSLTAKKASTMLIGLLEDLHAEEAKLLIGLIKKDLGITYLNPVIVKEAYPTLEI